MLFCLIFWKKKRRYVCKFCNINDYLILINELISLFNMFYIYIEYVFNEIVFDDGDCVLL